MVIEEVKAVVTVEAMELPARIPFLVTVLFQQFWKPNTDKPAAGQPLCPTGKRRGGCVEREGEEREGGDYPGSRGSPPRLTPELAGSSGSRAALRCSCRLLSNHGMRTHAPLEDR